MESSVGIQAAPTDPRAAPGHRAYSFTLRGRCGAACYSLDPSNAAAVVTRESDVMRSGIEGKLKDVSLGGVGVLLQTPPEVNETVHLILRNDIQKIQKETRGTVRHVTPHGQGVYHVGIELFNRLTPLEVSLLRMGLSHESQAEGPTWV
jgi:hypothetical protein